MIVGVAQANAIHIVRRKGQLVKMQNFSATDVYLSYNKDQLNATAPGTAPSGLKLAAAAAGTPGALDFYPFPGEIWARAATDTQIIVEP